MNTMLTEQDREQLRQKGISEEQLNQQLNNFQTGFPFLRLKSAASVGNGILRLADDEAERYVQVWDNYKAEGHRITKFVPASGAASRMFKDLFAFLEADYETPQTDFEKTFFDHIHSFAFYDALNDACEICEGMGIDALIAAGNYKGIVASLLGDEGLGYGSLPKGLIQFHAYTDSVRTPLEEHLAEAALYGSSRGQADVHFTVSGNHRLLFEELIERVKPIYEQMYGITFHISLSEQKSSTDTVAANADNTPFRLSDGSLLFRPGGHGALIENLNDLDSDIIFIKNIDNVVPDPLKPSTTHWKQVLAGLLTEVQKSVFRHLELLESGKASRDDLDEIIRFVQETLCCKLPQLEGLSEDEVKALLCKKLARPIRVCGMVRNQGEPGGGPFLAYNSDGSISLQILESSQINPDDPESVQMFRQGTHFNPVDLVCAVRDRKGQKYPLPSFTDAKTGFISSKSKDGRELKALELPGLWNGAMSDWITLMVEVPADTFNPVKTVNDLLRPAHQPSL